jgi:putative inorganic carbon (hco3(-)) transporter
VRKTFVRYAAALDLVVIATGVALLIDQQPLGILAVFGAAVFAAAWLGGRGGGATATGASLIVFGFVVGDVLRPYHYVFFTALALFVSFGLPVARQWRRPSIDILRRAAAPDLTPPAWLALALPAILVLIYTDLSEVLIRTFGVPSLLQPAIVALIVLIWVYRRALQPSRIVFHPITIALAAYCAVLFISTTWADDPWLADDRVVKAVKNLLVYGVVAVLAASWRALRRGLATLAIAGALLATISVAQIATGIHAELGGLTQIVHANIYGEQEDARAAGPLGDPNYYGQMLIVVIPMALYLAAVAERKRIRLFWLGVAGAIACGVLVTYSRGAMLGLAVMTGLVLIALRVPLTRVAVATAVALLLLFLMPGNIGRRFTTMLSLLPQETYYVAPDPSFERRKLIATTAALMFDEHPLAGVGAGNFVAHFAEYTRKAGSPAELYYDHGQTDQAHSIYLETASETGLLGLTVFAAIVVSAYVDLRRSRRTLDQLGLRRASLIALGLSVALSGFLVTGIFLHGASQRYLFTILALAAALSCIAADQHVATDSGPSRDR